MSATIGPRVRAAIVLVALLLAAGVYAVRAGGGSGDEAALAAATGDNKAWSYKLKRLPAAAQATWTFPDLPKGRYLVSYAVYAEMSDAGASLGCHLNPKGPDPAELSHTGGDFAGTTSVASAAASGVIDTRDHPYRLDCFAETGTLHLMATDVRPARVSFLRLDDVTTKTAPGA